MRPEDAPSPRQRHHQQRQRHYDRMQRERRYRARRQNRRDGEVDE